MSSMTYGDGNIHSIDDAATTSTHSLGSGGIVSHPYMNSSANPNYTTTLPSLGQYQHYYDHSLPQQQLSHLQPSSSIYPVRTLNHLQHQIDFSNSSASNASSSNSFEASNKTRNHKRSNDKTNHSTKSSTKRKASNNNDEENEYYLRDGSMSNTIISAHNHSYNNDGIGDEDKEKQARENHCEIERRRRIKMATYFAELCDMVPACSNLARKPDKLTILRMAAHFMKNLRTTNHSLALSSPSLTSQQDLYKPSFLNDQELKYLMVESCDAFLFALNCDTLRVIYVSDAIQHVLSYTCQDWYSTFIYDLVHPDDVEKVREQLNLQAQEGSTNGRILDLKTGTVKKDGHNAGTRLISSKRSFICRLRVGSNNPLDSTHSNSYTNPSVLRRRHRMSLGPSIDGQLYEVVHINGYIRNLTTHSSHLDNTVHHPSSSSSSNSSNQMAFIAIARLQTSSAPNVNDLTNGSITSLNSSTTEFTCRCHWETGEIFFIDQRCTPIIGYQSQDLLHKILFEQIHPDDRTKFDDLYKRTVTQKHLLNNLSTIHVRFRTNIDNEYVPLKTSTYAFCNPYGDNIEFIIVTFLSNKTSVITNSNDYNRQTYENQNGHEYSNGNTTNDGRTYTNYSTGSTWISANENWTTPTTTTTVPASTTTTNTDYSESQGNLGMYHQY